MIGWWILAAIVGVLVGVCVSAELTIKWTKRDGTEASKTFGKIE